MSVIVGQPQRMMIYWLVYWSSGDLFTLRVCLFGMEWDCEFVSSGWMDGRMDSRVNKDLLTVKEL